MLTPLISLTLVFGFLAAADSSRSLRFIRRVMAPLLALPHAAAAFGIAFLIAPSGWIARAVSPWASGWKQPPDLLIFQDPHGFALTLGLILKEVPFLLLMALAYLPQTNAPARLQLARSLGYAPLTAWFKVVAPALYPLIRLPVYAVIAYASSTIDMAMILGPSNPPTLAVAVLRWFNDPDLTMRTMASAGALLQLALTLAALLLWRLGEWVLARLFAPRISDGRRQHGDRLLQPLSRCLMVLCVMLLTAGMVGLALHSVAGPWRFPNALPDSLSGAQWLRAWPNVSAPLLTTVLIALASSSISLVLVIAVLQQELRSRTFASPRALNLLYLPLLVPQAAFLFGLVAALERSGLRPGLVAVIGTHCVFVLPYVYLSLAESYRRFDPRWQQLAQSLGASPRSSFFRIRLPMLFTPLLTAFAVGIAVSVGQYLPTLLPGAGQVNTVTTEALALSASGDRRVIGVWAVLQALVPALGFALALLLPRIIWRNRRALRDLH